MRLIATITLACLVLAGCSGLPSMIGAGAPEAADTDAAVDTVSDAEASAEAIEAVLGEQKPPGLLGFFGGGTRGPDGPDELRAEQDAAQNMDTDTSALQQPRVAARGGGFLGLGGRTPEAQSDVAFGTVLPYGRVAVICDVPTRKMGKKIAGFPERRESFALYDSDPGNTAAHTFYLTGFADGCARQFTASLAVFGSVAMHERLRYGLPAEVQPYSETDKAYETLKARVCGVPRRAPCGARISRLERNTVFLSIYERFGGNARWKNLLLHDGALLALDVKEG